MGELGQWLARLRCCSRCHWAAPAAPLHIYGEPIGLTRPRGGKQWLVATCRQTIHDIIEPAEVINAFLWFEGTPGKDADGKGVAAGEGHELKVFVNDFGVLCPPLIGVIIAAM